MNRPTKRQQRAPSDRDSAEPSAAARWVALLASGEATPSDVEQLDAWLSEDAGHRKAFDQARKAWGDLNLLESRTRRSLQARTRWLGGSLAAAAACAVWFLVSAVTRPELLAPVGEVRQVTLADGTRLWLDSGTSATFVETSAARRLEVLEGRVHVVVSPGRKPFLVRVEEGTIRDIGTAFTVDEAGAGFRVAVSEGAVQVDQQGERTMLLAGHSASFAAGERPEPASFDVSTEAAWREGVIAFDRTRLSAVVQELNRYYQGKILLADSRAGERVVSGSVRIDDLDDGLDALADSLRLRVLHLPFLRIVTPR